VVGAIRGDGKTEPVDVVAEDAGNVGRAVLEEGDAVGHDPASCPVVAAGARSSRSDAGPGDGRDVVSASGPSG
jgi:hypothetical protein